MKHSYIHDSRKPEKINGDGDNFRPLHVAAKWGRLNMCQMLLENNADIKSQTKVAILVVFRHEITDL